MGYVWQDDFLVPVIELDNGDILDLEDLIDIEEELEEDF